MVWLLNKMYKTRSGFVFFNQSVYFYQYLNFDQYLYFNLSSNTINNAFVSLMTVAFNEGLKEGLNNKGNSLSCNKRFINSKLQ